MKYIIFFLLISNYLKGQPNDKKRDYQWLFGYKYDKYTTNLLDFNFKPTKLSGIKDKNRGFLLDNANICDTSGKMLFYTNGCNIINGNQKIVVNSANLNEGIYKDAFCEENEGLKVPQSSMLIPNPNPINDSIYYLFHTTLNQFGFCLEFMQTTLNAKADNGNGIVTALNKKIIIDSIDYRIQSTRHANGRDWWILLCNHSLNGLKDDIYYRVLVTPDTVQVFTQTFGRVSKRKNKYYSQNCFSPDGTKFARYRDKDGIYLYDFDRQTGLLSNQRNIFINDYDWFNGISFSPNSRFIYAMANEALFQIDTYASNFENAKELVAKWDGYKMALFTTGFEYGQLGPDCKIYIAPQGTLPFLNIINYPNRKGIACGVEQRAIKLPTYIAWALPNYPNFRLGKLGDVFQPCDSTINPYLVANNEIISQTNPMTFAVYPNPAQDYLNVDLFGYVNRYERGTWTLYDLAGQQVAAFPLLQGHDEYNVDISSVPNGVYVWRVSFNGVPTSFSGKVVVMRE